MHILEKMIKLNILCAKHGRMILAALCLVLVSLSIQSCHLIKSRRGNIPPEEKIEITSETADKALQQIESNLYNISMLYNDVVTNGDAIIASEVRISNIINAIEENPDVLNEEQMQQYQRLREEYKKLTGN